MKRKLIAIVILVLSAYFNTKAENTQKNEFKAGKGEFVLNGEPYVIKAAELHYPRIPKEYWDHRIKMSKALGMNTICLYTFWNAHEPREGEFDFTGQNDIRRFIELCEENDMKVILRPGPYVCAEWEMGGLPWWLLKKKDIRLRENDPYFLERVEKFQEELARQIGDKTIDKGGPIIMIQVENEYGSYGEDKEYVSLIRDMLRRHFGEDVAMFQCDWNSNFMLNGLDDLVWTMNFGTGADIDSQFKELKEIRPESPLMCSEFWSGWFDKWGANHETRPADDMIAGIDEMLSKGISFSLYMTHGGTNWGHWAGANSPGYSPDVTSYDYDAPISESGQPTEKYWKLRETLSHYMQEGETLAEVPETIHPITIEKFNITEVAPLFDNLPAAKTDYDIKTFEEYDMGFGSILYSTTLPSIQTGDILTVEEPHDFAQIFINGELVGTLDRRKGEKTLTLGEWPEGATLDILVEGTGRINFGRAIKDNKGITDKVTISRGRSETEVELHNWNAYLFPDEKNFYDSLTYIPLENSTLNRDSRGPRGVYRGKFHVEKPSDTFLNFETWGKGLVYVNGHGIGRIWEIGPQQTLYMPGPWLREGENEILIFDILGPEIAEVEGLAAPIIDKIKISSTVDAQAGLLDLNGMDLVMESAFENGNGWKEIEFSQPFKGRYLTIEALSSTDGGEKASIAEIYLIDDQGKRISRESWTAVADSENSGEGNHTVDKIFDLQESTYWETASTTKYPHYVVIDLGKEETIRGLQYLPRMETGAPGAISGFRIYVKP